MLQLMMTTSRRICEATIDVVFTRCDNDLGMQYARPAAGQLLCMADLLLLVHNSIPENGAHSAPQKCDWAHAAIHAAASGEHPTLVSTRAGALYAIH